MFRWAPAEEIWLRAVWRSLDAGSDQPYPLSECLEISSQRWTTTWRRPVPPLGNIICKVSGWVVEAECIYLEKAQLSLFGFWCMQYAHETAIQHR